MARSDRPSGQVCVSETLSRENRYSAAIAPNKAIVAETAIATPVTNTRLAADHLAFLILALASWWDAAPQVARMITGPESEEEHARRRASVIAAARRLALP